jgi:hypothetical protein
MNRAFRLWPSFVSSTSRSCGDLAAARRVASAPRPSPALRLSIRSALIRPLPEWAQRAAAARRPGGLLARHARRPQRHQVAVHLTSDSLPLQRRHILSPQRASSAAAPSPTTRVRRKKSSALLAQVRCTSLLEPAGMWHQKPFAERAFISLSSLVVTGPRLAQRPSAPSAAHGVQSWTSPMQATHETFRPPWHQPTRARAVLRDCARRLC